jgi:hypothetical protein
MEKYSGQRKKLVGVVTAAGAIMLLVPFVIWNLTSTKQASRTASSYFESETIVAGTATITVPAIPTFTPAPTYMRYALSLNATAGAIAQTLPTASPIPYLPPEKQADEQWNDAWERAIQTAVILNPPPPNYHDAWPTPVVRLTPWPTRVIDMREAAGGILYNSGQIGPPCTLLSAINYWVKRSSDQVLYVCAGRVRDITQGAILVATRAVNHDMFDHADVYQTPMRLASGTQIIDVVGDVVKLSGESGFIYFDLATRQWVPPGPTPVPSPPPAP